LRLDGFVKSQWSDRQGHFAFSDLARPGIAREFSLAFWTDGAAHSACNIKDLALICLQVGKNNGLLFDNGSLTLRS